ncbi:MAG TPA: pyridoxal 5'-phosphate synthase glutaminase subunit PdxT [Desulfobacterales bacterium]|nr:pyridoxal 5'-phosphate synthase glutaminase subunit PdxT [Desulfobacterales bacterium]
MVGLVGVLDLQGGVQEHLDHLRRIGVPGRSVRHADDFSGLAGLILPGGETTCLARLLRIFDLEDVILQKYREGLKLWGTCAGAILLARENVGDSPYLGLIDIGIKRNAFGSQMDSFTCKALVPRVAPDPIPLTFIRAPKIIRAGSGVDVLLRMDDYIAAAESENVLVTVFHPELTPSLAFHRYFARKCGLSCQDRAKSAVTDPSWTRKGWMRVARGIQRHFSYSSNPLHPISAACFLDAGKYLQIVGLTS